MPRFPQHRINGSTELKLNLATPSKEPSRGKVSVRRARGLRGVGGGVA